MKMKFPQLLAAALAMAWLAPAGVFAQQVPLPKTAAEVPGPAAGNTMTKEYVQSVGRMAYVWGYAMVNSHNRTAGIMRWPGKIQPRTSDEMMHVTDWFPTLLNLVGHPEKVPTDRVLDGVDQSAFITGKQEHSNRDAFMMFFDTQLVGMRYKNFKVLTYRVEDGASPIQKLATPNVYNSTVNPNEDTPYNYEEGAQSWVFYKVFMPKARELQVSLKKDSVPFGAPLDFIPYKK